ncbi:MAG: hypothetical protein V3T05_07925 [Myxococcota bacterium]
MLGRLTVAILFLVAAMATGCPDRKKTTDEIGGAPKRQLDNVQKKLDAAAAKAEERLRQADPGAN